MWLKRLCSGFISRMDQPCPKKTPALAVAWGGRKMLTLMRVLSLVIRLYFTNEQRLARALKSKELYIFFKNQISSM